MGRDLYEFRCWLVDQGIGRQYPPPPRARVLRMRRRGTPILDGFLKFVVIAIGLWAIFSPLWLPLLVFLIVVFS